MDGFSFLQRKFLLVLVAAFPICSYGAQVPSPSIWMTDKINEEFAHFRGQKAISKKKIDQLITDPYYEWGLFTKYTIQNNKVTCTQNFKAFHPRVNSLRESFQALCDRFPLPDMDFIVSMHDSMDQQFDVPIFVMAKKNGKNEQILIPDFEALKGRYQVLTGQDITQDILPSWETRKAQMIWRGSTVQHPPNGYPISWDYRDPHCLSRVTLCALSLSYPHLIDAKFTLYQEGTENVACLQKYRGTILPYEDQMHYKYHMLIDGYSSSYSTSGWKFFSQSLVFKEDSDHIQWYYNDLKPYVHYIPVKEGLTDLIQCLQWAMQHDHEAKTIARQAREFALSHLVQELNYIYLYYTLLAYKQLNIGN